MTKEEQRREEDGAELARLVEMTILRAAALAPSGVGPNWRLGIQELASGGARLVRLIRTGGRS